VLFRSRIVAVLAKRIPAPTLGVVHRRAGFVQCQNQPHRLALRASFPSSRLFSIVIIRASLLQCWLTSNWVIRIRYARSQAMCRRPTRQKRPQMPSCP